MATFDLFAAHFFLQTLPFLQLSDSLSASPTTKFLLGVTAFNLGLGYAQDAQAAVKAKNNADACAATKSAEDYFATAQINVPAGATLATAGNLNNDVGLPMTLFGLEAANRFGALELETSAPRSSRAPGR